MEKSLTTGQMIDTLKIDQIAMNNKGVCVVRKSNGIIWCFEDGSYIDENTYLAITDKLLGMKWTILESNNK